MRKLTTAGEHIQTNLRPLLDWLLDQYPGTPRTRAKQWILAGRVSLDGVVVRKPHQQVPEPGDALHLLERHATSLPCGAGWKIHPRVTLLFLDAALAVVNKAPGLISVPAPDSGISALSILADYLAGRLRPRERSIAAKVLPALYRNIKPLPVHRLDQYTSGLFCMACNPRAREQLIEQLSTHAMVRQYVAFVEGRATVRQGTWRDWLALTDDELRQRVVPANKGLKSPEKAKEAITHFEVLEEFKLPHDQGFVTKLRLRLETGRKHQIRVQAAHAGLPLIGDRAYNPNYHSSKAARVRIPFDRQALHAQSLEMDHPEQPGNHLSWNAELPADLNQLEQNLRARS